MTGSTAELSAADLRRVVDCAERVVATDDLANFPFQAASALSELVPCDFASYNVLDPAQGRTQLATVPGDVLFDGADEALGRNLDEHPIVAHYATTSSAQAHRLSDFISQRTFHKLQLYDEVFRVLGNEYLLAGAPLVLPAPVIVGFGLHRQSSDFTDRERALMDLASPWIARAYEIARAMETVRALEAALEHEQLAMIVIDDEGRIIHATSRASDLLERSFGATFPPGTLLPVPVPIAPPGERRTRGKHRNIAWECVFWEGCRAVKVSEPPVRAPSSLSEREEEILALVALGRTNAEIAEQLFLSIHTIRRHLESIYHKLDVHTRAAAAAAYLRKGK